MSRRRGEERARTRLWSMVTREVPPSSLARPADGIRELTNLGRERRPRLHQTKAAITGIKAVQLCRKHNLKDLLSE